MIIQRSNVNVNGEACDVHARIGDTSAIEWCAIYVRPVGPVNGYWYEPSRDGATALLASLGVLS